MSKFRLFLAVVFPVVIFSHMAAGQAGCAQFAIYTTERVEANPGSSLSIDVAVNNTGTCAGDTLVLVKPSLPEGWSGTKFFTKKLSPGETEISSIEIDIPQDAQSAVITFIGDSATESSTEVVIGGQELQENVTSNRNETAVLPVSTPEIPAVNITNPPAPLEETTNETEEIQQTSDQEPVSAQQPAGSVTGLISANPFAQAAVFILLIFGAGYLLGKGKVEGFRYRYRN